MRNVVAMPKLLVPPFRLEKRSEWVVSDAWISVPLNSTTYEAHKKNGKVSERGEMLIWHGITSIDSRESTPQPCRLGNIGIPPFVQIVRIMRITALDDLIDSHLPPSK